METNPNDFEIGDALEEITPQGIKTVWLKYIESGAYEFAYGRIKDGNKYDFFGLLCLVMTDLGLDTLNEEEWNLECPPARVCQAVGIVCRRGPGGMAKGGDYETIEWLIDSGMPYTIMLDILISGDTSKAIKKLMLKMEKLK